MNYLKFYISPIHFYNKKYFNTLILPTIFTQILFSELSYFISKKNIILILQSLKLHFKFQYKVLSCLSGVDFLGSVFSLSYRFSIVYDLLSLAYNARVKVKVFLNEASFLLSSTSVFLNSNWWEREIWDMFGIWFNNHPDLRRILTDYGFDNFPLRKDFPLVGFYEVLYSFEKKRVASQPCELNQDFRNFLYENIWQLIYV